MDDYFRHYGSRDEQLAVEARAFRDTLDGERRPDLLEASKLIEILNCRRDAFENGALDDGSPSWLLHMVRKTRGMHGVQLTSFEMPERSPTETDRRLS